jgi:serine phosphatase RsbU (regulator of sigma subunit)
MDTGDRLFVYTDGIIDAANPEGESFGLKRLKDILDENAAAPLSELKSAVLRRLREYAEKELTHDDVTLIVLEIC